ncbi:MAG: hypothetical protein MUE73_11675 [Planctomycetes bacterium]|nr:hypothetical protein [Planctomycetota bacterium]
MRVVILHESPGADDLARGFLEAAEAFNRGLDFRLRFLDVGFSFRTVPVSSSGDVPAVLLDGTLRRFEPAVVLVLGRGLALLECAAAAAKHAAPLAYFADKPADRTSEALARFARILLSRPPFDGLPPDATAEALPPGSPPGEALVKLLVRTVRGPRRHASGPAPADTRPPDGDLP